MKDLLLAQRVSRYWKSVIAESIPLQQMLFFAPKKADFCWHLEYEYKYPQSKWPKPVDRDHKLPEALPDGVQFMTLTANGQMNPLVFETGEYANVWEQAERGGGTIVHALPRTQHPSMRYPEASWRGMLMSQPPYKSCDYEGEFELDHNFASDARENEREDYLKGSLVSEGYITCGDFHNKIGECFYKLRKHAWLGLYGMPVIYPTEDELAEMLAEQHVMVN